MVCPRMGGGGQPSGICPQTAAPEKGILVLIMIPFVRHFEKLSRKASIRDGNLTLNLGPRVGKISS